MNPSDWHPDTQRVRSKSIQSLGWIDRLLGDRKARERARQKAIDRAERIRRNAQA